MAQTALLALVASSPLFCPSILLWNGDVHRIAGLVFLTAGLALSVAGLAHLGSSLTVLPSPREDSQLRTGGIYRLVRHPIYGGVILLTAGYCLLLPSMLELCFPLAVALFFARKAAIEERWLRLRYENYESYAQRTRRFVPWLF